MKRTCGRGEFVFLFILPFFITGILLVLFIQVRGTAVPSPWSGYNVILLEKNGGTAERIERLNESVPVVSRYTRTVPFRFGGEGEDVIIGDIDARFDPIDPRLDPFAGSVGGLFEAEYAGNLWEVVYVPRENVQRRRPAALVRDGGGFLLAALPQGSGCLKLLLFLPFPILLSLSGRKSLFLTWTGSLPWVLFALVENTLFFLTGAFSYLVWMFLGKRLRSGNAGIRKVLPFGIGPVLPVLYFLLSMRGDAAPAFFLLYGTASAAFLAILLFERTAAGRRTPAGGNGSGKGGIPATLLLSLYLALNPVVFLFGNRTVLLPLPDPDVSINTGSFASVHDASLKVSADDSSVPGFLDYIAHRAFQDGLLYGYPYRIPRPDSAVTRDEYFEENGAILSGISTVRQFTESWYRDIISNCTEKDILSFYLDQDTIGTIRKNFYKSGPRPELPWVVFFLPGICILPLRIFGKREFFG